MKFPIYVNEDFAIEHDDVKFGLTIVRTTKRSQGQTIETRIPIVVNCGKLKLNQSGGNVSSAMSSASIQSGIKKTQEDKIRSGNAQVLDTSAISHATDKEALDKTFASTTSRMTNMTS